MLFAITLRSPVRMDELVVDDRRTQTRFQGHANDFAIEALGVDLKQRQILYSMLAQQGGQFQAQNVCFLDVILDTRYAALHPAEVLDEVATIEAGNRVGPTG